MQFPQKVGRDWVGIGSGLGRDWVGIGSGLGRDWVGIGSGLGRVGRWVGRCGSGLGKMAPVTPKNRNFVFSVKKTTKTLKSEQKKAKPHQKTQILLFSVKKGKATPKHPNFVFFGEKTTKTQNHAKTQFCCFR